MNNQPRENQQAGTTPFRAAEIASPIEPGQIEQVVSSADCREAEPLSAPDPSIFSIRQQIRDGETAGTSSPTANQPTPPTPSAGEAIPQRAQDPLLSLEDRLLVALSARGGRSIGRVFTDFFNNGLPDKYEDSFMWFYEVSDEDLVRALEREVFGDGLGLHRASPDEVSQ